MKKTTDDIDWDTYDLPKNANDSQRAELFQHIAEAVDELTFTKKPIHMVKTDNQITVWISQ